MSVVVTEDDFDIAAEHKKLKSASVGAIVTFTGTVRDLDGGQAIEAMTLEHYPGIIHTAKVRWPLDGVTVVHRVGRLLPQENIVFVGCASAHRQAAFEAAHFIMDYLKTKAPFWKKEDRESGPSWVDARETDYNALQRWDE